MSFSEKFISIDWLPQPYSLSGVSEHLVDKHWTKNISVEPVKTKRTMNNLSQPDSNIRIKFLKKKKKKMKDNKRQTDKN